VLFAAAPSSGSLLSIPVDFLVCRRRDGPAWWAIYSSRSSRILGEGDQQIMLKYFYLGTAILLMTTTIACSLAKASATAIPDPALEIPLATTKGEETAVLAGGCFWGIEAVFEHVKGVISARSGYSGGAAATAQYEKVSSGLTGHAESVQIIFDPSQVSYGQLLKVFFSVAHDPTELNRQGPDYGTQYRSAIFYANDEQKRAAQAYIDQLNRARVFSAPIVTQVVPLEAFYEAESYHQDYLAHHPDEPYIVVNDMPKVENLRKQLPELYKAK
jgi:peptide-methionine (S)-S-oxide reductase